jgi:hypothetical protein
VGSLAGIPSLAHNRRVREFAMSFFLRLIRQPLLHFVLIGMAVFAGFHILNKPGPVDDNDQIVVGADVVERLAGQFRSVWQRAPTAEELDGLIESHVREEVLVREALALSLDRNDPVIRQRLSQKMEFLIEGAAGALEPSDRELREYFERDVTRYQQEPQVSFEQVYLGEKLSSQKVSAIRNELESGRDPASLGGIRLLPGRQPMASRTEIDRTFGKGFFDQIHKAVDGQWTGPIRSGYGVHFVLVTGRRESRLPDFEEVRDAVQKDWMAEKSAALFKGHYERMRAGYSVSRPDKAAIKQFAQAQ